jgi:hypothetical protein
MRDVLDTSAWLRERRLERYEQPLQEHETDPEVLPGLTDGTSGNSASSSAAAKGF